jgi:hypothetical protein
MLEGSWHKTLNYNGIQIYTLNVRIMVMRSNSLYMARHYWSCKCVLKLNSVNMASEFISAHPVECPAGLF